ncbi:MAG: tetratricopeptide repeat protein [Blastocatellia bacterium]|nr:tetratricopeptide repeat protein [Blastocatellia bacterium]
MRVRCYSLVAALALVAFLAGTVFAQSGKSQTKNSSSVRELSEWHLVQTDNFVIVSNTDPERAKLIAYKLEQFRFAMLKLMPELVVGSPKATVRVFRDASSYTSSLSVLSNLESVIAGYFQRDSNSITINDMFNISDNVSFHEYVHLLARRGAEKYPLWFDEGIAQFYETFETSNKTVRLGDILASRLHSLRLSPLIPIKKLLSFSGYPQVLKETTLDLFYAQAWAFTHFLVMDGQGKRRQQLLEYIKMVGEGKAVEEAFKASFGTSFDELEESFRAYLERGKFNLLTFEVDMAELETDVEIMPLEKVHKEPDSEKSMSFNIQLKGLEEQRLDMKVFGAVVPDIPGLAATVGLKSVPSSRPLSFSTNDPSSVNKVKEALMKFMEANKNFEDGQTDEAMGKYEEAIKLDPEFAPAYASIGNIYAQKGLHEMAALAFDKALSVAPNYAGTYLNFAVMQYEQGKINEAELSFKMALSLYPSSAAARVGLGNIYLSQKQYSKARNEYTKAVKLTRGEGIEALNAYIGMGAACFYQRDFEGAKLQYRRAIEIEPRNAVWHRAYGDSCRMLKQYEEATAAYEKALSINPKEARAKIGLDWIAKFNEYKRTLAQYQQQVRSK